MTLYQQVSEDKTLKIWQEYAQGNKEGIPAGDWKCICTLSGIHNRAVFDVDWCHRSDLIVTACGDDAIRIFKSIGDGEGGEAKFELATAVYNAHSQDVNSVSWNPAATEDGNGALLASGSDDGEVKIWRLHVDEDDVAK